MRALVSLILLFFGIHIYPTFSQQQVTSHVPWTKEDSVAINALVLYPDSIRCNIFEACEYPAAIVNIASLQKTSSEAFSGIIGGYSKEEQEDFWNLSRYPGLISKLAANNAKTDAEWNAILASYPGDIHDAAIKYAKNYHGTLQRIDSLEMLTNAQFEQTVSYYPPEVRQTFRQLLDYPEILSLLNEHLNLTVRVGDHYKRDPQWVLRKADSANVAEAREHAQEVLQWKQTLAEDTNARNDLKKAANDFADSNGYKPADVNKPSDSNEVENYSCYPYPYWFGYPTWYPYAYWYPYPYWYDWGFYYGPYGNMIVFGLPSFYFLDWYFYYPWFWHHYPYLGNIYIRHYYGRQYYYNANSVLVHNWVRSNRDNLPKNFLTSPATRVEAIRNAGKFREGFQPDINMRPVRQPVVTPHIQPGERTFSNPSRSYNMLNRAQNYHRSMWESGQSVHPTAPGHSSVPAHFGGGRR